MRSMPWVDLETLIEKLPPEWGWAEENTARTHEATMFLLEHEYAQWTVDPDDPEYKAEQARRKREGIKPPPRPVIPPVALRPKWLRDILTAEYADVLAATATPVSPSRQQMSSAEFDRRLDL